MIWKITAVLQSLLKQFGAGEKYRPERHYMRGPGPKSRAIASGQRQS